MYNDSIYTIEEQVQLSKILDDYITYNENEFLILGEAIRCDLFLEEMTGGSVKRAVRNAAASGRRVEKKVSKAVDDTVDAAIDGGKKAEIKSIREDLMRGRGKVSTILKRAIKAAMVGVVAGSPAIALITFIISTIRRKGISQKEKDKILFEMKQELEILEEKIRDAEGEGNKKLKYQYMRLRTELQRNIEQLRIFGKIQQR